MSSSFFHLLLIHLIKMYERNKDEMQEKNKKQRLSVPSVVSRFHLEARRSVKGMSVIVGGVIGISDFSDETVLLKSHSGKIKVKGKYLSISIYEGGVIERLGKVEDISFSYGKN